MTTTNITALPPIRLTPALYPALVEARRLRLQAAALEAAGKCRITASYLRHCALRLETEMFAAMSEQHEKERRKG